MPQSADEPKPAQQGYAGTWVMKLAQRVFIVLTIEPQGDTFSAKIQGPSRFSLPMAGSPLRYSDVRLPIQERRSSRAMVEGGHLRLVVEDPNAPDEPDEYDMFLTDPDHASLQYVGIPVAALLFVRHPGSSPAPAPAADWEAGRTYSVDAEVTTANGEMAQIYDDDQKIRQNLPTCFARSWACRRQSRRHRS